MLKKGDIIFHAKLIFSFYFNIVIVIYIRETRLYAENERERKFVGTNNHPRDV